LVSNEFYVERLLCKDAAKIDIDKEFKCDLKNRIMFGDKSNNITQLPKRKNNFKQNKYFKIASGFVICVFVSGTIFKAIDAPINSIFASKGEKKTIVPISSSDKNSTAITIAKASLLQPKKEVVKDNNVSKLPNIAKGNEGTVDDILNKYDEKNNLIINKNPNKETPSSSDVAINESLISKDGKNASLSTDVIGPVNVPKTETKVDEVSSLKFYDSRYSPGEKSLVSVKDGGIYVKDIQSAKEKKLIAFNEKTQIVEKPNFTPSAGIIYYKAEKVTLDNGVIGEKNGAIYLADQNGQESSKLVDGKNPMVSKDGKKLVYETDGKIFILTLATSNKDFVDNGKYPAFSEDGNTISYVKENKDTQNYVSGKKSINIQKTSSNLWVYDLVTDKIRNLTNEVNINGDSIQSWVDAVRSGSIVNDLNVNGKYSYYESLWSSNNKEIYVIRKDNDAQIFDFIKFNLDK